MTFTKNNSMEKNTNWVDNLPKNAKKKEKRYQYFNSNDINQRIKKL